MTIILNGKDLAFQAEEDFKKRVSKIRNNSGIIPVLATILVGNDPASKTYVKMKGNACERIGMKSIKVELPQETSTSDLLKTIQNLNDDEEISGILLQHPTPSHINERLCFDAIKLNKDVDGVTSLGFGKMTMLEKAYGSCTPYGIMRLLEHYKIPLSGKHAVVVGRSPILGKPMAMMLLNANATVTICHSKTEGLPSIISKADIVVGAVGIPKFIKSEWIKDNSVVIDAGYHPQKCGDIDLEGIISRSLAYTPVPGGVGPMTIACLLKYTIECFKRVQK